MSDAIREQAEKLLDRLRKEIAREHQPSTVNVGGITKAGNELEALLRMCASALARASGSTLDRELARAPRGAGAYLHVIEQLRTVRAGDVLVEAIAREAALPRSRIKRMAELRNANNHAGAAAAGPNSAAVMRALESWLGPLLGR